MWIVVIGAAVTLSVVAWWRRRRSHHRHTRAGLVIDAKPFPCTQFGRQLSNDDQSHHHPDHGELDGN